MSARRMSRLVPAMGISVLVVSVLAACGGGSPEPADEPADPETSAPAADAPEEDAGSGPADYPVDTVHLVLPYSAGGGVDTVTRQFANMLPRYLDANFVVENDTGAGGRIGAAKFQKAKADGSYVWSDVLPSSSISQLVYEGTHDVLSWEPVYGYSDDLSAVVVLESSPFQTFDDLVAAAKERPLTIGNPGLGLPIHLQSVVLKDAIGIDYTEVPLDGTSGAFTALLGGNVDFVIGNVQNVFQYEGLRTLAVVGDERDARLKDVPSTTELGYDIPVVPFARGFFGPPGLPDDVRAILEEAFDKVVNDPEFVTFAEDNGYVIVARDSAGFDEAVTQGHQLAERFAPLLAGGGS